MKFAWLLLIVAPCQNGEAVSLRGVVAVVAGMIDGCDDKAGFGQRLRGVVVAAKPTAPTVRNQDERKLRPYDGTILDAWQRYIDGRRQFAERYIFRLACAWIPNRAGQTGI